MMKVVWYEDVGEARDVLRFEEMERPTPMEGEVCVHLATSGVNPSDVKTRAGARGPAAFPRIIPHSDGAGIIERVGRGVDSGRIGERVWIWNGAWQRAYGTSAEYICLPGPQAVPLPDSVTFEAGACLGIPASTAYQGVFSSGEVKNQKVLVTGGAGAVGHYAIQLARWGGAHVVATVSSSDKAEHAKRAGADQVINYRQDDVAEAIKDITKGEGVDRIVEVEFGGNLSVSQEILKTNGVIATYGSMAEPEPHLPFYPLMFKGTTLHMYLVYTLPPKDRQKVIEGLTRALSEEALETNIAAVFPLEETFKAHEAVEAASHIGNIVVKI